MTGIKNDVIEMLCSGTSEQVSDHDCQSPGGGQSTTMLIGVQQQRKK